MTLSKEKLRAIAGQEVCDSPAEPADDRRSALRVSLGRRARIIVAGHACRVMLHDISVKGVGFLSQVPVRTGLSFILEIDDIAGQPIYVQCLTRRCETGGMGGVSFVVGATFDRELDPAEVPSQKSHGRARTRLAIGFDVLRQLNPFRLLLHGFKRFDDYSSTDDTRWFRRPH